MSDDIDRLADFLDRDDPHVARILWAAQHNDGMRSAARYALRRLCKTEIGVNPDNLPVFPLVRGLPPGEFPVAHAQNGEVLGPAFALPRSRLPEHVGVFGSSGSGKSHLAKHLVAEAIRAGDVAWVLDVEDEYATLLGMFPPEKLIAVTPDVLHFALFQPPRDSVGPRQWLGEIEAILRWATYLRDGSLNLFTASMLQLFERRDIFAGSRAYPTLEDALDLFAGMRFGPKSRNAGFLESIVNRLAMLRNTLGETFNAATSDVLPFLASRSTIFRIDTLSGLPRQFLCGYLVAWLAFYKE